MSNTDRIRLCVEERDWTGLGRLLAGLSAGEFKRAQRTMREDVMTHLPNDLFWEALLHLIIFKKSAFITCSVAVEHLADNDTLDFDDENAQKLAAHLLDNHPEAALKMCNMMIPFLHNENQVMSMFALFAIEKERARLSVLLKVESPMTYHLIFLQLKLADDKTLARQCCTAIVKRHNDMAFNMVSLLRTYFGLDDLPTRFSLSIEPYELSHIDRDYTTFVNILTGKRPKI